MPQSDAERASLSQEMNRKLAKASSASDSIDILNNLYDLEIPKAYKDSVGSLIFDVAYRSGNATAGLDIIRNLANVHLHSKEKLEQDIKNAMKFPDSDDRRETLTFVRIIENLNNFRYSDEKVRNELLQKYLKKVNYGSDQDIYDEIVTLHAISLFLSDIAHGESLSKYLDRFGNLVDQLRPEAYALRNCYYIQAAMAYSRTGENRKAIAADINLLNSIDDLTEGRTGMHRPYRNYNAHRYIAYTRLLSNYPLLPDEDVKKYYDEAMHLAATDSLSATTNRSSGRPQIYYAMYSHDYASALRLIKQYIDKSYNKDQRTMFLKMLITAAEKTGDQATLLDASRQYADALEQQLDERSAEKYREIQVIYDFNQIKAENQRSTISFQRTIITITIVAVAILLILGIVLLLLWRHARKLAASLKEANEAMHTESINLRDSQAALVKARDEACAASNVKTDFIKNMSNEISVPLHAINEYTRLIVDCSESTMKPYLRNFLRIITLNSELLTSIINDVIALSEIDTNTLSVTMKSERLLPICLGAIESVKHKVHDGVTIGLEDGLQDVVVRTDSIRLVQILIQLLTNATKFTQQGSITLGYHLNPDTDMIDITVTDTGIGIHADQANEIFKRFVKLDKTSQGIGVGLSIARHLAELIDGTVTLDTDYTEGARFIVSIPA